MIIWEVDGLDAFVSGEINFFSPDVFRDRGGTEEARAA